MKGRRLDERSFAHKGATILVPTNLRAVAVHGRFCRLYAKFQSKGKPSLAKARALGRIRRLRAIILFPLRQALDNAIAHNQRAYAS